MLKVGGQWVSPVEVEDAMLRHPAVQECGVVSYGFDGTAERASELEQFVRAKLAEYKRPRRVEFLPELPKTATGKIQRFRLRTLATAGTSEDDPHAVAQRNREQ